MSNPNSPNLDKVIGSVVEKVLRERVEQGNQESVLEVVLEEMEIEVEEGEARAFYSRKGEEAFKKHLAKKGLEERGFRELVSPFNEEVEKKGWEIVSQHREPGRRSLVKEFYTNMGERKYLTCYVRGRWIK